jgi:hypothetical protein
MQITQNYYFKQVKLLLNLLPIIAEDPDFVLKGGTAINLFIYNMPRLSVDIDLIYQPIQQRAVTLAAIDQKLHTIGNKILRKIPGSTVIFTPPSPDFSRTLVCTNQGAQVKIEVNTIIRGTLFDTNLIRSCDAVEKHFQQFIEMKIASIGDLYGGKICAALDRQHPRDLFDIKTLLENGGITTEIKKGFLFYLISHNRPISELLDPTLLDMKQIFTSEFTDITNISFSYNDFETTRDILIQKIKNIFTEKEKDFLIGFKKGIPDWELSGIPHIKDYPAVQWKIYNIQKMSAKKKDKALEKLMEKIGTT